MSSPPADVVVVGGGLGGLAAALTAAQRGASVVLLEARAALGGFATCFHRGRFRFDASLHMLDAVEIGGSNRSIWEELGLAERVETRRPARMRREIWPDHVVDIPHGLDAYVQVLSTAFPHEAAGFRAFGQRARRVQAAFVADRDARIDGQSSGRMDPSMGDLLDCTTLDYLRQILRDPRAIAMAGSLTCYLGLGADELGAIPFLSMVGSYHGDSGSYPVGSSRSVTDALVEQLHELGVDVRRNTPVTTILATRGVAHGVRLLDGQEVHARAVVSNAPPAHTFGRLLSPGNIPPRFVRRLQGMSLGTSVLKVWLGLRSRAGGEPSDIPYESFIRSSYGTSFTPMSLDDIAVVAPHRLDPTCAPSGHEVYSLTTGLEADPTCPGPDKVDELVKAMLHRVEQVLIPDLRARIVVQSVATPATFLDFTGNPGGTIHGFRSVPRQSGPRRVGIRSPVDGLFQVGGWTYAGSGFLPALTSGVIAARSLLRKRERP